MRPFRDISIRFKLVVIIMLTTGAALFLASSAFLVFDFFTFRKAMVRDLVNLAQLTADNCNGSLRFRIPEDADPILASFKARPHVVFACILDENEEVFASYPTGAPPANFLPPRPWQLGYHLAKTRLDVFVPIRDKGEVIGKMYLQAELSQVYSRLVQYSGIAALAVFLSLGAALLLSAKLQALISRPVLHLAETARQVSGGKNYSLRAAKEGGDELGELIDAFNDMLTQIQFRDSALQKGRDELEARVGERTRELQAEIAERKETEAKLKTLAAQLERSNRELQAFAYVASHDLQEPLRKVQAFGDRLRAKCRAALSEEGCDYLERMQNAARRMQNLIDDLLLFSRVSTQTRPFESSSLGKIVREVLSDLEVRVQQTGGKVAVEELPVLEADPMQMRQLFQNLLSNALKFHRPGVPPEVRVRSRILPAGNETENGTREYCEIEIEDNGIGFEEKYLDRIFAVFQRLHPRGTYEGTGIGLAICRKIAERHGGSISARSAPGHGAVFVVKLPLTHSNANNNEIPEKLAHYDSVGG